MSLKHMFLLKSAAFFFFAASCVFATPAEPRPADRLMPDSYTEAASLALSVNRSASVDAAVDCQNVQEWSVNGGGQSWSARHSNGSAITAGPAYLPGTIVSFEDRYWRALETNFGQHFWLNQQNTGRPGTVNVNGINGLVFWEEVQCIYDDEPTFFTLTFDSDQGSPVSPIEVEEGEFAERPADPTRDGYIFLGWFIIGVEDIEFEFETMPITE
ncbi:MAG: InlB B-repeat-containing protein, partial [Chitinivibrionia bacterium]|nr:InlB B-repeat-containing protein [Chitinivibrionia bacterium]